METILKSIRVHLALGKFAVTPLYYVLFQNFKAQRHHAEE